MTIPFKSDPIDCYQHELFPSNVFDLLPQDHECFLFRDIIQQLDTSEVEQRYSRMGQHAYHPRTIVGILIYAYSRGVFSSRQIEQRCKEDLSFMYVAGKQCPNFRVLSDFRKAHGDFFKSCFKQSAQLAIELKLASLGHISLDGSKFKANSSKHKAMSYKALKEKEAALAQEIEALTEQANRCDAEEDQAYQERTGYELDDALKHRKSRLAKIQAAKKSLEQREKALDPDKPTEAIEDKKQISFADHDARIMGKKGHFDYAYNAQISVDSDHQIIVGEHISQNANDKKEVEPAIEQIREITGQLPEKMSMDNGYYSGGNLEAIESESMDAYIATDRGEKPAGAAWLESERKLVKADFIYCEDSDTFQCPAGQVLDLHGTTQDGRRIYRGDPETCLSCPYRPRCCNSKKDAPRSITTDDKEALRKKMNEKMATQAARAVYKQRKVIVEPVFGQIKNSGFRGFSVRSKDKVQGEFSLVCTVHNFKKIVKAAHQGLVCLKNTEQEKKAA